MATVPSITLIKKFTYRADSNEEWSNKYYLTGGIPADSTAWKALADALIAQEKTLYTSGTVVVRAYGYNDDTVSPNSVWSFDYAGAGATVPGTHTRGGVAPAGDQAAVVWWKTDRLNSKGKPIYLRKYVHDPDIVTGGGDGLVTGYKTACTNFATKLKDGTFLDARTLRSRTHADNIIASGVDQYVTTRTLKRRGKRP